MKDVWKKYCMVVEIMEKYVKLGELVSVYVFCFFGKWKVEDRLILMDLFWMYYWYIFLYDLIVGK